VARDIPVVTLPDGKVRILYRLRHYGGTTVTTAVDGGTQRRSVVPKAPDLAPLVAVLTPNIGDGGAVRRCRMRTRSSSPARRR
jgi:hypothetical protein